MAINVGEAVAYLSLETTAFNTGLQSAQTALQSFSNSTNNLGSGLTAIGSVASNVGSSLSRNLTVPIVSLGESSLQAYRDFESAFAGVKKTVDDTEVELIGGYDVLSGAIEDMATKTASSAEEIAGVMEVAGQLGVPLGDAGKDIISFTETMVMLGDSTNLSAEEAATAIARFANITGTSWQEIDNLGATIVDLGNNFAAQEDEIALMATRLASAGTIAGLTETEILALATAMTSVGIRAEAGGTAMSTTLAQIEKAVSGYLAGEGGAIETVEKMGEVAGMSADEFVKAWEEDPAVALESFLVGIGQLEGKGESAILVLDELGMSGVRQSNMLKALGLAGGMLTDSIDTANQAWEENTALTTEAGKRYETLDAQISQLNEEWKSMKRDLAGILVPVLKQLMDVAKQLIEWWKGLSEEQQQMIVKFAALAAAIGPVLMVLGNLLSSVGLIVQSFSSLKMMFVNFGEALGLANAGFVNFAGQASNLFKIFQSLAGPIGIAIVAIGALVAAVVDLWKTNEEFRENVKLIWDSIVSVFQSAWEIIRPFWELFAAGVAIVFEAIKTLVAVLTEALAPAFQAIADLFERLVPILQPIASILGVVLVGAAQVLAIAIEWLANLLANIINIITNVIEIVVNLADVLIGFATGDMQMVRDALSNIWENIKNIFSNAVNFIINLVLGWCQNIVDSIMNLSENASSILSGLWQNIKDGFNSLFEGVKNKISDFVNNAINSISNFVSNVVNTFSKFFGDMISNFVNFASNILNGVGNLRDNLFSAIGNFISNTILTVGDFLSNLLLNIGEFLSSLPSKVAQGLGQVLTMISGFVSRFFDAGANLFQSLWGGLKSVWDSIWGWLQNIWDKVTGLFSDISSGFSNAFSGFGWSGSHANGLDYVPYDGYVAQLHQGERVLTKQEARDYNGNNNNGKGGDTYIFYNTKPDPYEYSRQMKRAKKELEDL